MSTYQTTVEVEVDIPFRDIVSGLADQGKMLVDRPAEKMHTPHESIIEDMMRAARFYHQAHFNQLAQEFYQACQR
ncbi:hypothetical protein [uncultured Gilvimarinus sp.]|uniref:hypothetical protein n=1 Tax=uncultured Gilvimarinus sp. TaxID=1689143 RepID=UPI0030DAC9D1